MKKTINIFAALIILFSQCVYSQAFNEFEYVVEERILHPSSSTDRVLDLVKAKIYSSDVPPSSVALGFRVRG